MKCIITSGAGFIGNNLADKLAFQSKKFSDPLSNRLYFDIKIMNSIKLN